MTNILKHRISVRYASSHPEWIRDTVPIKHRMVFLRSKLDTDDSYMGGIVYVMRAHEYIIAAISLIPSEMPRSNPGNNIALWLGIDDGKFLMYGGYSSMNQLVESFNIIYEFRRVLIEKIGCI